MLLPVQVTFRNVETRAQPALERLVQKEAAKLERFFNHISSCRVMVERPQRAPSGSLYHVRIDVGLPNGELLVKHSPTVHGTLQDLKLGRSREEAKAVLVHKTPQRAVRETFDEMGRRLHEYAGKQKGAPRISQKMEDGRVKAIFPGQGYGFLETADGRELYFNQASVLDGHFDRLRVGSRVHFAEEKGELGPQASTVKLIRPRKQAQTAASVLVLPPARAKRLASRS